MNLDVKTNPLHPRNSASLPAGALALFLLAAPALCAGAAAAPVSSPHADPFSPLLLLLATVVLGAALGRWAAVKLDQPPVLGELVAGIVVGNIGYWLRQPLFELVMNLSAFNDVFARVWSEGGTVAEAIRNAVGSGAMAAGQPGADLTHVLQSPSGATIVTLGFSMWLLSNLGVILLLFMVGLETNLHDMMRVGVRATAVAVVGTVAPFVLGYATSAALMPAAPASLHIFLGATLCATSVGITARVFQDLKRIDSSEARIVLGAAVIDDVLGLLVLAVVMGIARSGSVQMGEVARLCLMSGAFFGVVLILGDRLVRAGLRVFGYLDRHNIRLLYPLLVLFVLSWVSSQIGLAAIVGAFAAGLILSEAQFHEHGGRGHKLADIVYPLEGLFSPLFFVLMGMQVNLSRFVNGPILGFAAAFIAVAAIGKLVSGLVAGKGTDRLTVGIGMLPRGEVGLIFASVGKATGVVTDALYSALVIVIIVTTLVTPPALKWSLGRTARKTEPTP